MHAFQVGSQSLAVGVIGILHIEVQIPYDEAIARKDVLFAKNLSSWKNEAAEQLVDGIQRPQ